MGVFSCSWTHHVTVDFICQDGDTVFGSHWWGKQTLMFLSDRHKIKFLQNLKRWNKVGQMCSQPLRIFCRCSRVKTDPHGLDGLVTIKQDVLSSMRLSMCFRSISHDFSGCKNEGPGWGKLSSAGIFQICFKKLILLLQQIKDDVCFLLSAPSFRIWTFLEYKLKWMFLKFYISFRQVSNWSSGQMVSIWSASKIFISAKMTWYFTAPLLKSEILLLKSF